MREPRSVSPDSAAARACSLRSTNAPWLPVSAFWVSATGVPGAWTCWFVVFDLHLPDSREPVGLRCFGQRRPVVSGVSERLFLRLLMVRPF